MEGASWFGLFGLTSIYSRIRRTLNNHSPMMAARLGSANWITDQTRVKKITQTKPTDADSNAPSRGTGFVGNFLSHSRQLFVLVALALASYIPARQATLASIP